MLKCEKCKRQTEPGESTGLFIIYSKRLCEDDRGRKMIVKQIVSQKRTCWNCSGAEDEK